MLLEEAAPSIVRPLREPALPSSTGGDASAVTGVMDRVFAELNANLEELRVAEEELRVQNHELADAREVIEQERRRYQVLFDFAPDAYLVTDWLGVVREANQASAGMLNLQVKYLAGKPLITFIPGEERLAFRKLIANLNETGGRKEIDLHLRPRKGSDFPVSITVAVVRTRAGEPVTLLWMLRDITERLRAEEARIHLLKEQQERRQREEALSHLQKVHADLRTDLEREQFVSHTLQASLLPNIAHDAFAGMAVTTAYQAALTDAQVGGDFYDAFKLPDGRIALIVGDASGKGLQAAARTAEVKFALRAFLREEARDSAATVDRLNRYLSSAHGLDGREPEEFYALVLAVFSPATGAVEVVTAGCELPIILRANGSTEVCRCGGGVLGIDLNMTYETQHIDFQPGDSLVLLTDGLTESRRNGILFGSGGVESALRNSGSRTSLPNLAADVLMAANDHADGSQQDDICLLIARRL